jgi:hypothetical protein
LQKGEVRGKGQEDSTLKRFAHNLRRELRRRRIFFI